MIKKLFFIFVMVFSFSFAYAEPVVLDIEINGVRSDNGNIMIGICANEDEFNEKKVCKYGVKVKAVKGKTLKKVEVEKGKYGIIVYHDENGNGKLDKSFTGRPKEGYGFSKNVFGAFGSKPAYKKSEIEVNGNSKESISLKY